MAGCPKILAAVKAVGTVPGKSAKTTVTVPDDGSQSLIEVIDGDGATKVVRAKAPDATGTGKVCVQFDGVTIADGVMPLCQDITLRQTSDVVASIDFVLDRDVLAESCSDAAVEFGYHCSATITAITLAKKTVGLTDGFGADSPNVYSAAATVVAVDDSSTAILAYDAYVATATSTTDGTATICATFDGIEQQIVG